MGATTTYQGRKATFTVSKNNKNVRAFTAVNKPAHAVTKKLGKRGTHATVSMQELRASVGAGSYRFYYYTDTGALKPISF